MNSTELETAMRLSGRIPTADSDYTSARCKIELYDALLTLFETPLVNSREGYWLQRYVVQTVSGQDVYRLPHRAIVGAVERVEFSEDAVRWHDMARLNVKDASLTEGATSTLRAYTVRSDSVEVLGAITAAQYLRVHYYIRPSQLVTPQPTKGNITAVDHDARTITVDVVPDDYATGSAVPVATTDLIDVVSPQGNHELQMVDGAQTLASTTFTITDSLVDMSRVSVGDVVRAAGQSDWPALPQDFHRTLADAAASVALMDKGYLGKAQALASKVSGDMRRLQDLLQPRVKDSAKVFRPRYGVVHGSTGFRRRYRT